MNFYAIFLPFIISFFITALITPLCIRLINFLGLIDNPKTHQHPAIIHHKPIPRGGGLPIFIGIIVTSLFFLPFNNITIALFVSAFIALAVGLIDDRFDISRYFRFLINILCALIIVGNGVNIPFITNPIGSGILHLGMWKFSFYFFGNHQINILSDFFALVWIVWVMNMLNWSKGVDGQMPGVVAISAIIIGILSFRFSLTDQKTLISAYLSFIIAGAAIGFLIYNFYPAKIFPGYGTTSMYLLLASVSILSGAKLATAFLVMGVPMVDGLFTIIRRILAGRSPFWHDNKHLHHLLLKLGYGQRRIALFYWIISAILGGVSLTLSSSGKLFAIAMLIVIVSGGLFFLHISLQKQNNEKSL